MGKKKKKRKKEKKTSGHMQWKQYWTDEITSKQVTCSGNRGAHDFK